MQATPQERLLCAKVVKSEGFNNRLHSALEFSQNLRLGSSSMALIPLLPLGWAKTLPETTLDSPKIQVWESGAQDPLTRRSVFQETRTRPFCPNNLLLFFFFSFQ